MSGFENLNIYDKVSYIGLNMQLVIGTMGILGNLLVIILFSRRSLHKYSYSLYIRFKAVFDLTFLLFNMRNWARTVLGADLELVSPFACAFFGYMDYFLGTVSQTILLIISIDRLFTVVYSNRFQIFRKRWFQYLLLLAAIVYGLCLNIMIPINKTILEIPIGNNQVLRYCYLSSDLTAKQIWIATINVIGVILTVNSLISFKLFMHIRSSRNKVASYGGNNNQSSERKQKNDRKFTIAAIGQSIFVFGFKLTGGLLNVVVLSIDIRVDLLIMIYTIAIMFLIVEGVTSFLVNYFVNTTFREEFMTVFCCREPTSQSSSSSKVATNVGGNTKNTSSTKNTMPKY